DLIPLVMHQLYKPEYLNARYRFARWLERQAIVKARHIVAISQNTADDITKLFGIPPDRITVTPLAVEEGFFHQLSDKEMADSLQSLSVEKHTYLLYVGGIDPRKNI